MKKQWVNLQPSLIRQRVIIEALTPKLIRPRQMVAYLRELAKLTDMKIINGPKAYSAHDMGFGGWVHWRTSGAAIYSYPTNPPLVTVDCYTCKPFNAQQAAEFTANCFKATKVVWKEV